MGVLTREVREFVSLITRAAPDQGGVISGDNPTTYLASDPFRLWVIQLVIILAMIEFLHFFLRRLRQPRVIAEVLGGIILGPTVMMRIPGFQNAIFPTAAMPGLTLTSTIGLVIFLFLVGLEVDTKIIKQNVVSATAISVAGLLVPLGLGAAVGVGIYRNMVSDAINFGYFVLFSAVAVGITAFPVLCRILTELKLLDTTVGVVTLGAGVGNDIVGWILLALAVALVNASTGLTALYILLACVGYILVLLIPGRWGYVWLARRTGSLEQGSPTPFMMTITLVIVMASAFYTDIIGVHAIFGGFVAGLIIPHENGYAISLVEKLEDLVCNLFIPIYFTLSGLRTDLSALNTGTAWAYTVLLCFVSFSAKFFPCFAAAISTGFNWREAGAIGALMSCKGLVELIVLNVGLQAGILDTRTFSMFVVHALVLTVTTTPLTLFFYPAKYRVKIDSVGVGGESGTVPRPSSDTDTKTRFALILDKIEQLPAAMTICQLLQPDKAISSTSSLATIDEKVEKVNDLPITSPLSQPRIAINALRLIELTSRTSAVLKSQLIYHDPVVSVFRTFGYLNRLLVSAALSVVSYDDFTTAISKHVVDSDSQMVILPWSRGTPPEDDQDKSGASNPFDGIFHKSTTHDPTNSVVYSEFIRNVFATSPSPVALYVDRGISAHSAIASDHHLFLPFFGGPDDRLALSFVVQLCSSPSVRATVMRIRRIDDLSPTSTTPEKTITTAAVHQTIAAADTIYGQQNTAMRLASDTADDIIWSRYASPFDARDPDASALSRVRFDSTSSSQPLQTIIELVKAEISQSVPSKDMIVVAGRSRRMAVEYHKAELQKLILESGSPIGSSVSKTLGDVGAALVATSTNASLLVLQGGM